MSFGIVYILYIKCLCVHNVLSCATRANGEKGATILATLIDSIEREQKMKMKVFSVVQHEQPMPSATLDYRHYL